MFLMDIDAITFFRSSKRFNCFIHLCGERSFTVRVWYYIRNQMFTMQFTIYYFFLSCLTYQCTFRFFLLLVIIQHTRFPKIVNPLANSLLNFSLWKYYFFHPPPPLNTDPGLKLCVPRRDLFSTESECVSYTPLFIGALNTKTSFVVCSASNVASSRRT